MDKVLVVGCGGAGGKTVAFMMDQLKADLHQYGIEEIPACWQFISVDARLKEESMSEFGIENVGGQGGQYVACGVQRARGYNSVHTDLLEKFTSTGGAKMREVATWMPKKSEDVSFSLESGAGQHRAIGRLLMTRRLGEVSAAIQQALARMSDPDHQPLIDKAARLIPGANGGPDLNSTTFVFLISSMAGGSGSSMTIDVARILGANPNIDSAKINVFLYTPDVFSGLPEKERKGIFGNSLAMIGEIIAAQATGSETAARADVKLYGHHGVQITPENLIKIATPVGRSKSATVRQDSNKTFRATGKGLARFISSPLLQQPYESYYLGNPITASTKYFGWGVTADHLVWGSFGYASLSLGRERYLEYATQRISRRVVDHAMEGHRVPGDTATDAIRLGNLWEENKKTEIAKIGLPDTLGAGDNSVIGGWPERKFGGERLEAFARNLAESITQQVPRANMTLDQWADWVHHYLTKYTGYINQEISQKSKELVAAWTMSVQKKLVESIEEDAGELGLSYAGKVLEEFSRPEGVLDQFERLLQAKASKSDMTPLSQVISKEIVAYPQRQRKAAASEMQIQRFKEEVISGLTTKISDQVLSSCAETMTEATREFKKNAVTPLKKAVNEAVAQLKKDKEEAPRIIGVAQVETNSYQSWPEEPRDDFDASAVPQRFQEAQNEIVIMGTNEYLEKFKDHIKSAYKSEVGTEDDPDFQSAYFRVRSDVMKGTWKRIAGEPLRDEDGTALVKEESPWIAKVRKEVDPAVTPHAAAYSLRTTPSQIRDRARKLVERRGEDFWKFADESLYAYVTDGGDGAAQRQQRQDDVVTKLKKAIQMAPPPTSLDSAIFKKLHNGAPVELTLNFSSLPFLNAQGITNEFTQILQTVGNVDQQTCNFMTTPANWSKDPVKRVDIFGFYSKTLPVTYAETFEEIRKDWDAKAANTTGGETYSFWEWRRARPISAAIPFGVDELKALIQGWFTAVIIGAIKNPGSTALGTAHLNDTPVEIWDREKAKWVEFPTPMLTPPGKMVITTEFLPAVLESSLLAFLRTSQKGLEGAFRPYVVLRQYADASPEGPLDTIGGSSETEKILLKFLQGERQVTEGNPTIKIDPEKSFKERKKPLKEFIAAVQKDIDSRYLPGEGKRDEAEWFTNYTNPEALKKTPLTIDLAQDMYEALGEITKIVERLVEPEPIDTDEKKEEGDEQESPPILGWNA